MVLSTKESKNFVFGNCEIWQNCTIFFIKFVICKNSILHKFVAPVEMVDITLLFCLESSVAR